MHKCVYTHREIDIHTNTHTLHTQPDAQVHVYTQRNRYTYKHIIHYTHTQPDAQVRVCTQRKRYTYKYTHTHYTHTHTYTHIYNTHTCTHTLTHIYMDNRMHVYLHMHAHYS